MARSPAWYPLLSVLMVGLFIQGVASGEQPLEQADATAAAADSHDAALQQLALERARSGDWIAAVRTLSRLGDARQLARGLGALQAVLPPSSAREHSGERRTAAGARGGGSVGGSPGGSSFADFSPLIDLIQSTISPEAWEDGGGTSTIRPYPAGILVDPTGLVVDASKPAAEADLLANITVLLAQEPEGQSSGGQEDGSAEARPVEAWRLPAPYRCVSLRGMAREVVRHRLSGSAINDELRHVAGLSRIDYVVLLPAHQDVILIGPIGGIQTHNGWARDLRTGLTTMRLDHLAACMTAVLYGQPLGCSIDPTTESLSAAARVGAAIRAGEIPLGSAEEALRAALGEQTIRIFGIPGDTPLAYLMVQADRHMKRLSLGLEPMPRGTANYLDMVDQYIERGAPDGQLLRLWFTAAPMKIRTSSDQSVFHLAGRPMKLSSQTELAGIRGERLASADDVRLVEFVKGFNNNLDEIIRTYPAYGALQSVYTAAAVAEVLRRSDGRNWIDQLLAPLLLDDIHGAAAVVPARVQSIATGHRVKHRGKRHFVLLASGGVRVEPREAVDASFETYPAIDGISAMAVRPADRAEAWWWDVQPVSARSAK